MAMQVIQPGVLSTFQDNGRWGMGHWGVPIDGCMDNLAARVANLIVGNHPQEAVLEMHYPAPTLLFDQNVVIALAGASFGAMANGQCLGIHRRIFLPAGTTLRFTDNQWGQRNYLALQGGWHLPKVLGSYSTCLLAGWGGWKGRHLQAGDVIPCRTMNLTHPNPFPPAVTQSQWSVRLHSKYSPNLLFDILPGPEWYALSQRTQDYLLEATFTIMPDSDRMALRLQGATPIACTNAKKMLSSPVLPGTIQALPNGQLAVLMPGCQTTGGYPRIAQVAAASLPRLAQARIGSEIKLNLTTLQQAVDQLQEQEKWINQLKINIMCMPQHIHRWW